MQATRLCITAKPLLKGHSVYSTAAGFNFLHNQRFFSFSAQRFNEEETPKTPEADVAEPAEEVEPIKLSRRRRRFHEWMKETGHKFSRPSKGTTNYLAATPFPNNPLFQPRPPLSDATKQEIYEAFVSDSENWTVRKLATKFGISLKRVEAILKLKSTEKEMEMNGVALQKKFAKGMEQLMGVDKTIELLKEPLADVFPNVGKPKFKTLKEDATFGPKDAAKVLNTMPYKDLEKRAIEREQAEFTLPKPSTTEQTAKHTKKFVIVDTSS
ncbi:hypothetical protein G6F57_012961 [Rhizopus arrhizus]|uniref:Uncharacterized protein n=1 Tax=Rhizopus oryzae TaxID=64495 RepID=A0A9P7BNB8_RHIOR|nr:hypothetical protein G6F23_010488 [Rhizopus arrhizus]KAG1400262.1 hypothetical protein G6F58_010979 [Rhizopus delemar]KAG0754787.1 hypothetical protein G6F24_012254 [Rhizopus arrhizus]KAG0780712.1 hypothetical protein G6F21_012005 [Rhizopus arrhizus]KAG0780889.1 hypothetical protein G6F22_009845 [Rhizopus arrhizus]